MYKYKFNRHIVVPQIYASWMYMYTPVNIWIHNIWTSKMKKYIYIHTPLIYFNLHVVNRALPNP